MAAVDINKAIEIAVDLVRDAHSKHTLQELTKAKVRQRVADSLEIDAGTLDEKPYKKQINEAVDTTIAELKSEKKAKAGDDAKKGRPPSPAKPSSPSKKRKSTDAEATGSPSKPTSSVTTDLQDTAEDKNTKDAPPTKPTSKRKKQDKEPSQDKTPKKKAKQEKVSSRPKPKEEKTDGKSKEVVHSDEEDGAKEDRPSTSSPSTSASKKKGKRPVISDTEDEEELVASPKRRRGAEGSPSKTEKKPDSNEVNKSDGVPPEEIKKEGDKNDTGAKSDSELSVLIDESPTKKKKEPKKTKKSKDGSEKKSRPKKESKDISPDEEQIKKLKSLVVACGVRKVWSKELKDCETPSSQISHLRKLLTDLGMKGRFSLEQAKTIKAKRDLEKEMADVQEFAQRFAGERPKRSGQKTPIVDASSEEEGEEEEAQTSRRPKNAHRSIMEFLGDQSDSD